MSNKHSIIEKKVFEGNMFAAFDNSDSEEELKEKTEKTENNEEVIENIEKNNIDKLNVVINQEEDDSIGWTKVKRKHDVDLIYGRDTWQYKVITNRLIFEDDNQSVLEVFELKRFYYKFKKAKNNYYRNKLFSKMMRTITEEAWNSIKNMVIEKNCRNFRRSNKKE
jgi:hypothetical protein